MSASSETLRVVVLGSGSSGNATAITDGTTTVLVDCGFSARETSRRLVACGLDPNSLSALFVTHEHGDHTRGIEVFARRFPMPVYASAGTRGAGRLDLFSEDVRTFSPGDQITVGTLRVQSFRTSHDSAQPSGYRVVARSGQSAGIATDTGVLTPEAAEALAGCELLAIESNHDSDMLDRGPYPYFLKNRIRSDQGHLANHQAGDALEKLAHDRLTHVIAMHRSAPNNTKALVISTLTERLERLGLKVAVTASEQNAPCWAGDGHGTLFGQED